MYLFLKLSSGCMMREPENCRHLISHFVDISIYLESRYLFLYLIINVILSILNVKNTCIILIIQFLFVTSLHASKTRDDHSRYLIIYIKVFVLGNPMSLLSAKFLCGSSHFT